MITRQSGAIVPILFGEIMDPKTHKTRVRLVDVGTEWHTSAHVPATARLTPAQAHARWQPALVGR